MVNKIVKTILFLLSFSAITTGIFYFNNAFAFDKFETHPALTDEIIKFYNANSQRKITDEELSLIKIGSQKEDESPRWINHYYDAIHNNGLLTKYLRGTFLGMSWEKALGISMPKEPIKSIDWVKNEDYQLIYGSNRTWQKAIRLYFDKKEDGFIALGAILHLLEDLGVPEHARADGHVDIFSGTFINNEVPSYYENYAKSVDIFNLNSANNLIQNKEKPHNDNNIENIFSSLSSYTANNWFSEDTIKIPEFQNPRINTAIRQGNYTFYYGENKKIIALGVYDPISKETILTTNQSKIHQQWLSSITPEIIKYGANLINLYFAEIEKMEKDNTLIDISRLEARDRRVKRTFNLAQFINLKNLSQKTIWGLADIYHNTKHSIAQIFNKTNSAIKNIDKKLLLAEIIPPEINNNPLPTSSSQETTIYEEITRKSQPQTSNLKSQNDSQNNEIQNLTNNLIANIEKSFKKPLNEYPSATPDVQNIQNMQNSTFVFTGGPDPSSSQSPPPSSQLETQTDKCESLKNSIFPKIIISEIQYESSTDTKDEYIEFYNPNETQVNLDCFELKKINSSGTESTLIPKSKFAGIIQPQGFFLISNPLVQSQYNSDLTFAESYSFTKNNSLKILNPTGEISDLVGFGDDTTKISQYEESPFIPSQASYFPFLTFERMNLIDTDNNLNDFWNTNTNPETATSSQRTPRIDFANLTNLQIKNFAANFDSDENKIAVQFTEPQFSFSGDNYEYKIYFSTSTITNNSLPTSYYSFLNFGSSSTIPTPKFNNSNFDFAAQITICPIAQSSFNIIAQLIDKIFPQNYSLFATTTFQMFDFCDDSPSITEIDHSQDNTDDAQKGKIVISEIKIASASSTKNEYIELYNLNSFTVNLENFSLVKLNKNNTAQIIVPKSKFKGVIYPFSYFLIANESATELSELQILPDITFARSYNLAKNNSIKLLNDEENIVDEISWSDIEYKSIQRKAGVNSTSETMLAPVETGGENPYGNSFDSDSTDDFLLMEPDPQNSEYGKISPDYPKLLNLTLSEATATLTFLSPYRYFDGQVNYELRVINGGEQYSDEKIISDWNNLKKIEINLPEFRYGAYNENFEFNVCGKIEQNDQLVLGIIKDNNLYSFANVQLTDSPNCPIPQNLTINVNHSSSRDSNEPLIKSISIRNETENSQLNFSGFSSISASDPITGYLKLAKNQTFSHSFTHMAGTREIPVYSYNYQISVIGKKLDNSEISLYSENFSEQGAPSQFYPRTKTLQFQIPDDVVKLNLKVKCKREPLMHEIFTELLEITIE